MSFAFDPIQRLFNGDFWPVFQSQLAALGQGEVIDLACGTGELRRYISPKTYLGIDINSDHINFAQKRFQSYTNTHFQVSDITNLNISKNYQTAFFISAVHHLSDQQLEKVFHSIKKGHLKQFVIIDGFPQGMFSGLLKWLDKILAGGAYFRDEKQMVKILNKYFTVEKHGTFSVRFSFYSYPYAIVKL